jgi:hypothetical protein
MVFNTLPNLLAYIEPALWLAALLALLRVRKQATLTAFGVFLGIRLLRSLFSLGMMHTHVTELTGPNTVLHSAYFYAQWISYLAGCVALFFALQELFLNMMAPLPGLRRLGLTGFRWAAAVSAIIGAASVITLAGVNSMQDHLNAIFTEIAVSFSVLALCLLAFLAISIHALGLSYRNRVSGLCLGLVMVTAMDLMVNGLHFSTVGLWPARVAEVVVALSLITWTVFLVLPEPLKKQETAAISSSAMLWNDLAQELGAQSPQPAPAQQSGFLQNVESVVDRVLAKNAL